MKIGFGTGMSQRFVYERRKKKADANVSIKLIFEFWERYSYQNSRRKNK